MVARGDRCIEGTHYSDVFAPVVHFTTARTFLSMCCQRGWSVQQMDVSTAFVNADLDRDDIYFELPPGGLPGVPDVDSSGRRMVLHARRALYGLPQSPRLWSQRLHHWLLQEGFTRCRKDPCYYIKRSGGREVHLLVYVDDLAFAGNCPDMISDLRARLNADFKMTDMGQMSWFLGCEIVQDLGAGVTTLHQAKYIRDVVSRFEGTELGVIPCFSTPSSGAKLPGIADRPLDPTAANRDYFWRPLYRPIVGCLLYASVSTRPEIANEVRCLTQHLSNPGPAHWALAVRVLGYLKHDPSHGIRYTRSDDPALANRLFLFTDATWADCEDTRKSTTGIVLHLNGGPTSWKSKRQPIIAQSSCESEIIAATYGANEACFVRELLAEIGLPSHTIRAYEDNTSTRQLANDPGKLRNRSKHFELRFMVVQDLVQRAIVSMVYVPTKYQLADLLTKSTTAATFSRIMPMLTGYARFDHSRYSS